MSTRVRLPMGANQRTQGRACAVVLSGLAAFLVLQLGLAVSIETIVPEVRDPLYGCRLDRVHQRLHVAETPQTAIMLGSSRTRFGFRAGRNDLTWGDELRHPVASFNFGVDGGGPLTELLTWRRLDRDGVRPDLLLVEVMPPYLGDQPPPTDYSEGCLPTSRLSWQDLPFVERYAGNVRSGLRRNWLQSWPLPWYAHRYSLVSLAVPGLLPPAFRLDEAWKVDASGAMGFIIDPAPPEQRAQGLPLVRMAFQPYLTGLRLGGAQCEALRELLVSCRGKGVPVALVLMPEGPAFRSWYPPEVWQAVQEWLDQLGREFDAPVVNAREWCDEDDFRDSNHLLKSGADKFTERLGRETILPLLRRHSASP